MCTLNELSHVHRHRQRKIDLYVGIVLSSHECVWALSCRYIVGLKACFSAQKVSQRTTNHVQESWFLRFKTATGVCSHRRSQKQVTLPPRTAIGVCSHRPGRKQVALPPRTAIGVCSHRPGQKQVVLPPRTAIGVCSRRQGCLKLVAVALRFQDGLRRVLAPPRSHINNAVALVLDPPLWSGPFEHATVPCTSVEFHVAAAISAYSHWPGRVLAPAVPSFRP